MTKPIFNYDDMSDTLYVSFEPSENATGIELNDHILLRINKKEQRAVGLTFLEYSLLVQKTEMGHRSFPLSGLASLSSTLKSIVLITYIKYSKLFIYFSQSLTYYLCKFIHPMKL